MLEQLVPLIVIVKLSALGLEETFLCRWADTGWIAERGRALDRLAQSDSAVDLAHHSRITSDPPKRMSTAWIFKR